MAKKYVQDRANCSAWVVLKAGKLIGKVQVIFGNSKVTANVWDYGKDESFQVGSASGYGYDKQTAALAGCTIGGVLLNNHCGQDSQTAALLEAYTRRIVKAVKEGKTKKSLDAIEKHYSQIAGVTGAVFANYEQFFITKAGDVERYNFKGNQKKAPSYWRYTSLYLQNGLKKLEMLGFEVYQAI